MIAFLLRRPVSVGMFYLATLILGYFSYKNLTIDGVPDTELPQLVVSTGWFGTTPEVIQVFLTSPIEEAASQVEGLEEMVSSSTRGNSQVTLKFNRDTDMEFARLDLNERLSKLRKELPPGAAQPQVKVLEEQTGDNKSLMSFAVSGPFDLEQLTELFNDQMRGELAAVTGVAEVMVNGEREKALKVFLNRKAMDLYKIVPSQVRTRIQSLTNTYETVRTNFDNREYTITIENSIASLIELENVAIATRGNKILRLSDIAHVELGHARENGFSRLNGDPVLSVHIEKETNANVIATSRAVRAKATEILTHFPKGFRVQWITDSGKMMEEQLQSVYERSFWSLVLIVILLLLFLQSLSAASLISLNILLSVVLTINFMYYFDVSFNVITLSGLAIGFGMLVDNAIVVLENIFRHRELGKSRHEAAIKGSLEVLWPTLAATLTTVAAFLCMVMLDQRLKVTYWPLALAVIFSLSASMLVSFTFTPLLSLLIRGSNLNQQPNQKNRLIQRWLTIPIQNAMAKYVQVVYWTLHHKMLVLSVVGGFLFMFSRIYLKEIDKGDFGFFSNNNDQLSVVVRLPEGAELETADDVIRQFELPLSDINGCKDITVRVSSSFAILTITFERAILNSGFPTALKSRLVGIAQNFGGVGLTVYGINNEDNYYTGFTGYESFNSSIRIMGYNFKTLKDYAEAILKSVKRERRVKSTKLETSRYAFARADQTETVLAVNRDSLRRFKIDLSYLMGFISSNLRLESQTLTKFKGEEMNLEIKFSDVDDFDIKALENLVVTTVEGDRIRLADLVTLEERLVPSGIDRKDQQYAITIKWDYKGSPKKATAFTESIFYNLKLPPGYKAELDYERRLSYEEESSLWFVFGLAAVLVFMIIAALYESFVDPFVIFLTIPLSFIGVSWIYWMTGASFDSTAYIGLIILAGIVVNNSILLVDHINHSLRLAPEGSDLHAVIAKACGERVRPILLTAITTIVGLLPLLQEFVTWFFHIEIIHWVLEAFNIQIENLNPTNSQLQSTLGIFSSLSRSTLGGMLSATFSSLFVIPVIYGIFFRGKQWLHNRISEAFGVMKFDRKSQEVEMQAPAEI